MRTRCLLVLSILSILATDLFASYTLNITKVGTGSGHLKVNETARILPFLENYNAGFHLTVEAVADDGSEFTSWSGAGMSGTTNPVSFNMPAMNVSVTARFSLLEPDIASDPASWNYGSFITGNHSDKTFSISNTGKADLAVASTTLSGANASEFSIQSGGGAFTLAPGAARDITVRFNPMSKGGKSASLSIASNDPDENPFIIGLTGTCPALGYTLFIAKGGDGRGRIQINGVNMPLPFSNAYVAGAHLTIEAVPSIGSEFSGWSGGGMSGTTNPVTFNMPAADISATATFTLLPVLSPDIAADPPSWDFGAVGVNRSADKIFIISNLGNANLNVGSHALTGSNPTEFSVWGFDAGGGLTLTPGASRDITVRFNPFSTGGKNAGLTFTSNDPDEGVFTIPLTGTGVAEEYIANFGSFPGYPYNTAAYKQGGALIGCGPTTGAMIFAYFQAANTLAGLLTNPGAGVDAGLNTSWVLHGGTYMQTLASGFGSVYNIKPGLEGYARDRGYLFQVTLHVSPEYSAANPGDWNNYGGFGDAWTNDADYMIKIAGDSWRMDPDLFCNFLHAHLSQGRPIFLTIDSDGNGDGDHWVACVGFNRSTLNYAFYNTYDTNLHWAPIIYMSDPGGHRANSISLARTVAYLGPANQPAPDIASDPASWDYGSVPAGNQSDKTFSVSNSGNADLNVASTTLTGANASEFSIQSGGGAFTAAPGAARNITVRFSPVSAGGKSAALSIASNDPDESPFNIGLTGTCPGAGDAFPPPTSLVALAGYNHAIPLAWKAPANVPQGSPVRGYAITRSDHAGNAANVAGNITQTTHRDETVNNDETYSYTVRAVYDNGQSAPSSPAQNHAHANGYFIDSQWTSAAPVLDGAIEAGEWSDAATVDIAPEGSSTPVTLYVMNNATSLFMAVDDQRDPILNHGDQFYAFIDKNRDRQWPSASGSEGNYGIYWDGSGNATVAQSRWIQGYWPDNLSLGTYVTASGVGAGIAAASGNVQYETSIELGANLLQSSPDSVIGILIGVYDNNIQGFTGYWPQSIKALEAVNSEVSKWGKVPFAFGDLQLAPSSPQTVNVTFRVAVPSSTPAGGTVTIAGSFNGWNASADPMTKTGADQWEITLPFTSGQALEYKYTRGAFSTVEKGSNGQELSNRTLTVQGSDFVQNDVVANWADISSSVAEDGIRKVTAFSLGQNYPNPFNPSTTIPFDVKESCRVVLKVYDATGREVTTAVDWIYAPGAYKVRLDAAGFAPGIYLYRIEMGNFRAMRKMVVVE